MYMESDSIVYWKLNRPREDVYFKHDSYPYYVDLLS